MSMFHKIPSLKEKLLSHEILFLKVKLIFYKIKIYHMAGGYLCLEADVEIFYEVSYK